MAYKDEYEVARLYTDGSFAKALGAVFEGSTRLTFHLAPPILARRDPVTGHLRKQVFGPWVLPLFRILAFGKRLRATPFDPFGWTAERREERRLIAEYKTLLDRLVTGLSRDSLDQASRIAGLALEIRGYGHVKQAAIDRYRVALAADLEALETQRRRMPDQPKFASAVRSR